MDHKDIPSETEPRWEAPVDDVDAQYSGVGVSAEDAQDGTQDIEDGLPADTPNTIYSDLARELLDYTGQTDAPPEVTAILAEYMESGVMEALTRPLSETPLEDGANPARAFLDRTEQALADGTLRPHLDRLVAERRAAEIAQLGPIARMRAQKAEKAAARERYEARQHELQAVQPEVMERGRIPVQAVKPQDEVQFELRTDSYEANVATCTLSGTVDGPDIVVRADGSTAPGVAITIKNDDRTNPDYFLFEKLPPGTKVVLTGTALTANNYETYPGEVTAGETPVMYRGAHQVSIRTVMANLPDRDGRALGLGQLTINGVKMFHDPDEQRQR